MVTGWSRKLMVKVWLREERFDAALPLGSRSVRNLSASQIRETVRALRAVDARWVDYASWITEAWRVLQWAEPTAKLLWEMLLLVSTRADSEDGTSGAGSSQGRLLLSELALFLWLHLPDAFSKVSSQSPAVYNITWPDGPASSGTHAGGHAHGGGAGLAPLGVSQQGSSVPTPMMVSHPSSPRSPRSYFPLQAWQKAEAHHVTFVKRHFIEMLASLVPAQVATPFAAWSGPASPREPAHAPAQHTSTGGHGQLSSSPSSTHGNSTTHPPTFSVSAADFDLMGFLLGAGADEEEEDGDEDSMDDAMPDQGQRLSHLVPFWRERGTGEPCPVEELLQWLERVLCVNEVLYPPPPDPFSISPPDSTHGSSSRSFAPSTPHQPHTHAQMQAAGPKDTQLPVVVRLVNHGTVLCQGAELPPKSRVYIQHCNDAHIYMLGALELACVAGCTDCTVVLGAVGGLLRVVNCERLTLVACGRRLVVCNCLDSTFNVFVASNPVLAGDNRGCRLAPYNSCYPGLQAHLAAAGLPQSSPPAVNFWNSPYDLSSPGPSLQPPSSNPGAMEEGVDAVVEGRLLAPEQFHTICVPVVSDDDDGMQMQIPFALPLEYAHALKMREEQVHRVQRSMAGLTEAQHTAVKSYVNSKFLEWLTTSGNLRQVVDLCQLESPGESAESVANRLGATPPHSHGHQAGLPQPSQSPHHGHHSPQQYGLQGMPP